MQTGNMILRILLHSFFLISSNLFSVIAAFAIMQVSGLEDNKLVQGSIALVDNVLIDFLVYRLMSVVQKELMQLDGTSMLVAVAMISLALMPAVFYPMHFLIRGEWSTFDNLLAIWPFQLIINGFCLVLNYFVLDRSTRPS